MILAPGPILKSGFQLRIHVVKYWLEHSLLARLTRCAITPAEENSVPNPLFVMRRWLAAAAICAATSRHMPGEMIAKEVPTQRVKPGPKIIYGSDDRLDFYEETNPERMKQALSTCAICDAP